MSSRYYYIPQLVALLVAVVVVEVAALPLVALGVQGGVANVL